MGASLSPKPRMTLMPSGLAVDSTHLLAEVGKKKMLS